MLPDSGARNLPHDPTMLRRRVSGAEGLKETQVYPQDYGRAVHAEWDEATNGILETPEAESDSDMDMPWEEYAATFHRCSWKELELRSIAEMLNIQMDRLLP